MTSNFVDYIKIYCRSGNGGPGSTHLRREKYIPKGGPDGGDGGRGAHVILRGNKQYWTLIHLKYRRHVLAVDGASGSGARRHGADGEDKYIDVPLGTVVKCADTGNVICEITDDKEEKILVPGGQGGRGNWHFKTATNQTPRFSQPGMPGHEQWYVLELKLLADVGLVGFPNAGKSTLLSVVSEAKPEIADYPFTTLVPNLGIVAYRDFRSFVMADIPGIIEDAHLGKGIGTRFLRHIERNSILLFMVAADEKSVVGQYNILLNELKMYNPELLDKNRVLAITKTDLIDTKREKQLRKELEKGVKDIQIVFISSIANTNIDVLKDELWKALN